jgi:hypothetical protein
VDLFLQDLYFSENLVVSGIEPEASRSMGRISGHYTTKAIFSEFLLQY